MIRKKNNGEYQQLYEAILSLETMDECRAFLEDICTINEVAVSYTHLTLPTN